MLKENKQRLAELELKHLVEKFPSVPVAYQAVTKWNDSSANALTKSITAFLNFNGHQAERINTMGVFRQGAKLKVGEVIRQMPGKYTKSTGTKGSADISATIQGRSVKIEVKYGKDRQSEAQKEYQQAIENAGGIYFIAKTFDEFITFYDSFIAELK